MVDKCPSNATSLLPSADYKDVSRRTWNNVLTPHPTLLKMPPLTHNDMNGNMDDMNGNMNDMMAT
jgi:hypothetical protein